MGTSAFDNKPPDQVKKMLQECQSRSNRLQSEIDVLRQHNIALLRELEAERKKQQQIHAQLLVNANTGLYGYQSMMSTLDELISSNKSGLNFGIAAMKKAVKFALVVIKLDNQFDHIVKTLKDSASEWIMYQIASRLQECLGCDDQIFHVTEDEFVAILAERPHDEYPKILNRMHEALNRHHSLAGVRLHVGSHIGLAAFPMHGRSQTNLLHAANIALSEALKADQPWVIFRELFRSNVVERMELQNGILKALESHSEATLSQFKLVFQPQVSLRHTARGGIAVSDINAEVLLRWDHPTKGRIPPATFIPLAEETGLIQPLGTWLVYRTVQQLEKWENSPLQKVTLSLNVSPKQFLNDQLVWSLDKLIRRKPAIAQRLKLELTESSLLENTNTCLQYMHYLRGLGLQFAVDDFGKDYSSLSYLKHLPVNTIKLDKSFITNIQQSKHDRAIVRAVSRLARDLRLKVVVEGVETANQLGLLLQEGCSTIQGFFFSRPIEANQLEAFYNKVIHKPISLRSPVMAS